MKIKVILFLSLLLSGNTFAAYYYSTADLTTHYPSPDAVCTVVLSTFKDVTYTNLTYNHWATIDDKDASTTGSGYCYYNRTDKFGNVTVKRNPTLVTRYTEAAHVPNACSKADPAIISRGPYSSVIKGSDGNRYIAGSSPSSVCSGGCMYEKPTTANTKDCYALKTDGQTGFCNYGFTLVTDNSGDGTSCPSDTAIPYETGASLSSSQPGTGGDDCDPAKTSCDGTGDDGGSDDGSGDGSGDGTGSPNDGFKTPGHLDLDPREGIRKPAIESQYLSFQSTFDQSATATSIKSSLQSISSPGAACPVGSFSLFGREITIDAHCTLFDSIAPTLSFVFNAAWCLVAVLIILSA